MIIKILKQNKFSFLILTSVSLALISRLLGEWLGGTFNDGISFGLGNNFLSVSLSFLSILIISYLLFTKENLKEKSILSVIWIGGFANLFERLIWGNVSDYLSFFGLWYFNVADFLINGGVLIYLLLFIIEIGYKRVNI